jgi:hypothetical protein
MPEVFLCQNIPGAVQASIPATDTVIYSNNIKSTEFNHIRVSFTVAITPTATSLVAPINIKLKLNGATLFTWVHQLPSTPLAAQQNYVFEYISDARQAGGLSIGGALTVTIGTASLDTHTSVQVLNMYAHSLDD